MMKKLQIFVSSTYKDLIEERQASVEAILNAGHIPAGMELFQAGNESQLKTIYKWIDESDIYMLILGGRYGSIEPVSKKSYTHLEYEYAISQGIPTFAVVLNDNGLHFKAAKVSSDEIFEKKNLTKYKEFKSLVLSKVVKIVEDSKDVQLATVNAISSLMESHDFVGWVRGDSVGSNVDAEKKIEIYDLLFGIRKEMEFFIQYLNSGEKDKINFTLEILQDYLRKAYTLSVAYDGVIDKRLLDILSILVSVWNDLSGLYVRLIEKIPLKQLDSWCMDDENEFLQLQNEFNQNKETLIRICTDGMKYINVI